MARPRAPSGACGLGGVIRRSFYSYSVINQPVISTYHNLPFVDPTQSFRISTGPFTAKPFLSLILHPSWISAIDNRRRYLVCQKSALSLSRLRQIGAIKIGQQICTQFIDPLSWRSHIFVIQPGIRYWPKTVNHFENPISTGWVFLVLGRILRFDYLQFCLSSAEPYWPKQLSEISFLSTAPLLMLFLSLRCLFINCRDQLSAVFLYRQKLQSAFFLSKTLQHFWGCFFLLDVCFKIAMARINGF